MSSESKRSEYQLKPFETIGLDAIEELWRNAFDMKKDAGYFKWKYHENPAGESLGSVAIADDGTPAAFFVMIAEDYVLGGARKKVYQACDVMTHRSHRRRGLFRKLASLTCNRGAEIDPDFFGIGFSGMDILQNYLDMGWQLTDSIPFYMRPTALTYLSLRKSSEDVTVSEGATEPFLEAVERFYVPERDGKVLDTEFLRWRLSNPSIKYFTAFSESAAIVWNLEGNGIFLVHGWEDAPGSGRAVVKAVERVARLNKSRGLVSFAQRGSAYEAFLKQHGFFRNDFGIGPGSMKRPFITIGQGPMSGVLHGKDFWGVSPIQHDSA
jgi:hypothetical protein